MRAAASWLVLSLAACGCAAFGKGGPATFRDPAAQMAKALGDKAEKPALRAKIPAESLHDARIAGNRVLLDYRGESGGAESFDARSTCGPLELRDVATNERVWSLDRPSACDDVIFGILPRIAVLGVREEAGKEGLALSTLALDSGALVAKLPLQKGAFAAPSGDALVVVDGAAGARHVSLHDADKLEPKWKVALDDAREITRVVTVAGTVLVFGGSVTAIDRGSGKVLRSTVLGAEAGAAALDVRATADAAYALILRGKSGTAVAKIGADGGVAWTSSTPGILDAVTASVALVVDGSRVTALRTSDGTVAWTGKLPGAATGGGLVVPRGQGSLWLVPHAQGVAALDVASGALRFSVSPFSADTEGSRASERLSMAGPDLVLLDTARGVAGLDLANEGRPRYAIAVRSLPHAHRQGRLLSAYGKYDVAALLASAQTAMDAGSAQSASMAGLSNVLSSFSSGGVVTAGDPMGAANNQMLAGSAQMALGTAQMSMAVSSYAVATGAANFATLAASMNARRVQQATIALRQARLDDESPLLLRPISWSMGRGLLVIRKADGAFREVLTGPPDVYEDPFRPASIAAFVPLAKRVLTFSEGLDPSAWEDSIERAPVKLVARSLLGYALDEATFHPASEYEQRTVVPAGGLGALAGEPDKAARPTPAPAVPPPPAAAATATATAAPKQAPAPAGCRTHLDCKGGLVCPRGQCVPAACVADRECAAGQFCSLEGMCEPAKR